MGATDVENTSGITCLHVWDTAEHMLNGSYVNNRDSMYVPTYATADEDVCTQ